MNKLYKQVVEKFYDKGYETELHWLVVPPPIIDYSRKCPWQSKEEWQEIHNKVVDKVYSQEWDYWNTWIDYQNYK